MDDARATLYERYISTFKADHRSTDSDPFPETKWYEFSKSRHYEHLYLPLLDDLSRDARILELGCGSGDMVAFLEEKGFEQVIGIDISGEQIAIAQERGLNCQRADVFSYLDSTEDTFDVVIAKDFVEHFTTEELLHLASKISEVLTEDGGLILETPNGRGLFPGQVMYGDLTHKTILTPQSVRQLLKPYGFTKFRFEEAGPTPTYPLGVLRVVGWKLIKMAANFARLVEQGKSQRLWTENMLCRCTKKD
jgi:SAM-dependent methyltransferase